MMSFKELQWHPHMVPRSAVWATREAAAAALHYASVFLARLAAWLVLESEEPAPHEPCFEFHAEAGAPEGALYVDGELVGWLRGVHRL